MIQKGIQGELPNQSRIERKNQGRYTQENIQADDVSQNEDLYAKLDKLADLKLKGVLSESEFQLLKSDILKKISSSDLIIDAGKVDNNQAETNPINNFKNCPNSKCKSSNSVTSLFCKFCGTKL